MLLPLSGPRAALGKSMRQAALLVQSSTSTLDFFDTGEGAASAANSALAAGAGVLLGPVTTRETIEVLDTVGAQVSVVSFSNNQDLAGGGAFVFGITPQQSVETIFEHALSRGLRDIAVVVAPGELGTTALAAATDIAGRTGVDLVAALTHVPEQPGLAERLFAETRRIDAVLLPVGGDSLQSFARDIRAASEVPLLGTVQWSNEALSTETALRGAVFAAPDPAALAPFAARYRAAYDEPPGVLAALAYDAAAMSMAGGTSAPAILRRNGYEGVVGDFRFRSDRTMIRSLAVLTVGADGAA